MGVAPSPKPGAQHPKTGPKRDLYDPRNRISLLDFFHFLAPQKRAKMRRTTDKCPTGNNTPPPKGDSSPFKPDRSPTRNAPKTHLALIRTNTVASVHLQPPTQP